MLWGTALEQMALPSAYSSNILVTDLKLSWDYKSFFSLPFLNKLVVN